MSTHQTVLSGAPRGTTLSHLRQASVARPSYGEALLQLVLSPASFVSAALLINAAAPVSFSLPDAGDTHAERMARIYHASFCLTHDPTLAIPAGMLPLLDLLAKEEEKRFPPRPETPILPVNTPPVPAQTPAPTPTAPCCQEGNTLSASLPRRWGKGAKASKLSSSTNS
jgi:hypothetical protein